MQLWACFNRQWIVEHLNVPFKRWLLRALLLITRPQRVNAPSKPLASLNPITFDWFIKLQGGAISHNMLQCLPLRAEEAVRDWLAASGWDPSSLSEWELKALFILPFQLCNLEFVCKRSYLAALMKLQIISMAIPFFLCIYACNESMQEWLLLSEIKMDMMGLKDAGLNLLIA